VNDLRPSWASRWAGATIEIAEPIRQLGDYVIRSPCTRVTARVPVVVIPEGEEYDPAAAQAALAALAAEAARSLSRLGRREVTTELVAKEGSSARTERQEFRPLAGAGRWRVLCLGAW